MKDLRMRLSLVRLLITEPHSKVKRNPKSKSAIDETLQIEKFFRSSWYQQLTSVDGEFLIRKLQDEIRQSE